jgi:hypothetical protein
LRRLRFGRWRQRDRPQIDGFHTRPLKMNEFWRVTLDKKLCFWRDRPQRAGPEISFETALRWLEMLQPLAPPVTSQKTEW